MSYKNLQQARSEILVDHPKSKLIKNKLDRHVISRSTNYENDHNSANGGGMEGSPKHGLNPQRTPKLRNDQNDINKGVSSSQLKDPDKSSPGSSTTMTTTSSGGSNIAHTNTNTMMAAASSGNRPIYTTSRAERMGKTKQTKSSNQLASNSPHVGPVAKFRPQETYSRRPLQSRRVSRAQAKRNQTAYSTEFHFDGLSASPRNLARTNPNAGCDIPVTITNKNSIRHTNLSELGSRQGARNRKTDSNGATASTINSSNETEEADSNWWLKNFVTSNGFYSKEQRMRDTAAAAAATSNLKGHSPIVPSKYYNLNSRKANNAIGNDNGADYDNFKYGGSGGSGGVGSTTKKPRKPNFLPTLRQSNSKSRKDDSTSNYPKHTQSRNSSMPVRNSYDTKPSRFNPSAVSTSSKTRSFVKKPATPIPVYSSKSTLGSHGARRKGVKCGTQKGSTGGSGVVGGSSDAVQSLVHRSTTLHEYYNVSIGKNGDGALGDGHQGERRIEKQMPLDKRFKRDRFIKSNDGIIEEVTPPDTPSK